MGELVSRSEAFLEGMDRNLAMAAKAAPRELEKAYSSNPRLEGHAASNFELEGMHKMNENFKFDPAYEAGHSHMAVYSYDSTLHPERRGAVTAGLSGSEKPPTPVAWSGRHRAGVIPA